MPQAEDWDFEFIYNTDPDHGDLAQAIGRVAFASASLESALRGLMYRLAVADEMILIADGETPEWLIKKCKRLIRQEHKTESARSGRRESLIPLLDEVSSTFGNRGVVIHSSWGVRDSGKYVAVASRRERTTLRDFTVAEINALADKFLGLAARLDAESDYGT
jgi:hypothetical protein